MTASILVTACTTGARVPPSTMISGDAAATGLDHQGAATAGHMVAAVAPQASSPDTTASVVPASAGPLTEADLDRRTAMLFGDALNFDADISAMVDTSVLARLDNTPTWDIEVRSYEALDRVQHYLAAFSGPARGRIADRLRQGTRYEPMIRRAMRGGDLPEDLYYLALVESGFNPHAYSSAAAVGMWQFMTSTGRSMGLRIDWWVDERRDPVRSTQAAVRFLRGLREQFGSIYLAAAAYNGGPGRISRGLTQHASDLEGATGDDVFFALAEQKYLRSETRDYVPQLVAAALVAKDPVRYGLAFDTVASFAYDSVRVGPRVPLAAVAKAAGATVAEIQELNPHILRGMTPPSRDSMTVRVPAGSASRFDSVFATLPASAKVGGKVIKTTEAASWAALGKKTGVSSRSLPLYNPLVKPARKTGTIAKGSFIFVPAASVVTAALSVPDPSIERYGAGSRTHVVKKGENLSVIAKRYGTSANTLMRINRLQKPLIFPGQELVVRGNPVPAKAPAKKPAAKASASGSNEKGGLF